MWPGLAFVGALDLRYTGEDDRWQLLAPFACLWDGGKIEVPPGFVTDLSSIPQMLQSVVPVVGPQNLPAVVHDYIYARAGRMPDGSTFTRKAADALFLAGLEAAGVSWWRRRAMYAAVRLGGRFFWGK